MGNNYRPITDNWILARAKLIGGETYYGAYPGGFPERARVLIGCPLESPMLHVCGGMARLYPYKRGFGINDRTMDLNPRCHPDYLMDCRDPEWPKDADIKIPGLPDRNNEFLEIKVPWGGILIDSAYSEEDQKRYSAEVQGKYPKPNQLVQTAINTLRIGYKVGILHYVWPACPRNAICVAKIDVTVGYNNRCRVFAVYERIQDLPDKKKK